jgi:hypothetical protein
MYFTILILEAECIVNGTRVAVNRDRCLGSSFCHLICTSKRAGRDSGAKLGRAVVLSTDFEPNEHKSFYVLGYTDRCTSDHTALSGGCTSVQAEVHRFCSAIYLGRLRCTSAPTPKYCFTMNNN